jgi:hypothetical protein
MKKFTESELITKVVDNENIELVKKEAFDSYNEAILVWET